MKKKLSLTGPQRRVCIRIYIFNFKKQQTNKRKTRIKKAKQTNEEKRISPENQSKKIKICGRPGEDFSRHPYFRKLEYYFLAYYNVEVGLTIVILRPQ